MKKNILIIVLLLSNSLYAQKYIKTQTELNQASFLTKEDAIYLGDANTHTDKIHDLSPLSVIDSILAFINITNTNVVNLNALNNIKSTGNPITTGISLVNNSLLNDITGISNYNGASIYINNCPNIIQFPQLSGTLMYLSLIKMSGLSGNISANFTQDRSYLLIDSCPNITSLSVQVKQDTNSEVYIRNNAKLETVNYKVVNPKNYIPTQYMEIIFYNRKTEFENNSKLSLISATNNYYGFTRFRAVENPLLDDLCIFKQSVKTTNEIFSATLQQDWNAQLKEGILGIRDNAPGANSIEEVIAKDCIALQEEEVEDEITAAPFGVYPNPYTGGALQLSGVKTGSAIAVYDMVGKLIYSTQYTGAAITLPPLNNGLYLVETTKVNGHKAYTKLYAE
jgi:hypothetical protein